MNSDKNINELSSSPLGDRSYIRWNASLYDNKHDFVAKYGEDVLAWLQPEKDERILDVGCGTGTLTSKLVEAGANVTGIDASADMIERAKTAYPNIEFFIKDATDFVFSEPFDAVFSNATLHWINEQEKALQCIYNVLKKGGRFVFEMGGKHNIKSIHKAVIQAITEAGYNNVIPKNSNYFPSVSEQSFLLEKVGFSVANVAYFKRPTTLKGEDGMKNWIIQFCTFFFTQIPADHVDRIIDRAVEIVKPTNYKEGTWYGDYVRLRVKTFKGA